MRRDEERWVLRRERRRNVFRHDVLSDWSTEAPPSVDGPTFALVLLGHARHKQRILRQASG